MYYTTEVCTYVCMHYYYIYVCAYHNGINVRIKHEQTNTYGKRLIGIFGAHTAELYTLRDVVMHAEWYVGH